MTARATSLSVSVVIPTHNPRSDYLARVIEALRHQTLPHEQWEIILVDNGSRVPLKAGAVKGGKVEKLEGKDAENCIDLSWHQNARIVREEKLGLTFARLRGFAEAQGELVVMVDDDNVLAPDYLETAVEIAGNHPVLGAFGGRCLPEFEVEPEGWLASVTSGLGLRDLGEAPQLFPEETSERSVSVEQCFSEAVGKPELLKNRTTELPKNRVTRRVTEFPDCAPIGAGMVLRREAAAAYAERIAQRARGIRHTAHGEEGASVGQCCGRAVGNPDLPKDRNTELRLGETARGAAEGKNRNTEPPKHRAASVITDRRGDSLASGGDNDICLTVLEEGGQVGYLPQLQLTHLIPKQRMTLDYHKRMAREAMRSFILMLDQHGIRPWGAIPRWSVPLRVAKDYLRVQPWRSPELLLKWSMNRGRYEACAALPRGGARQ